jgi:uncharacterized damage-inducible protein DinB
MLGQVFEQVDALMEVFISHSKERWQTPSKMPVRGESNPLLLTPLELFTHVITHEFHHKGQVLTMSRLLGYTPVDTDVVRF